MLVWSFTAYSRLPFTRMLAARRASSSQLVSLSSRRACSVPLTAPFLSHGHVAAGTSTGGMTGKRWGRIGDSPVIGAGTYAADGVCAVSATGSGEYFIRTSAAKQICDRIQWSKVGVQAAADATIADIGAIGGDGGVIVLDGSGRIAFAMNSSGMYRGWVTSAAPPGTAIYSDEKGPAR